MQNNKIETFKSKDKQTIVKVKFKDETVWFRQ